MLLSTTLSPRAAKLQTSSAPLSSPPSPPPAHFPMGKPTLYTVHQNSVSALASVLRAMPPTDNFPPPLDHAAYGSLPEESLKNARELLASNQRQLFCATAAIFFAATEQHAGPDLVLPGRRVLGREISMGEQIVGPEDGDALGSAARSGSAGDGHRWIANAGAAAGAV